MNFTCDNCQKRYSIADEKVRGKTVKVRCKNCQNVITVEGPAEEENTRVVSLADVERIRAQERSLAEPEASAAPAAVISAPIAAAPVAKAPAAALQTPWDDEPTRAAPMKATGSPWFVMVRNKQEGPLDEGALRELVATNTVNGRSFFWQQGMADWKRGSDIPELAGLFEPPPAAEPPPPPPAIAAPPPPEPARPSRGAPVRREPEPQAFIPEPEPEPRQAESEQPWPDEEDEAPDNTYYGDPLPRAQPQPQPQAQVTRRAQQPQPQATNAAPLDDALFSDLDLPGNRNGGDGEEPQDDGGVPYPDDPRAALGGGEDDDEGKAVEDTRHFAKKSGVTRRNPAWKYAVFALLLLIVPLGLAYVLSETLGVVPLRVQTVDASGNAVEQPVFSSEGVGALRDKLMGRGSPPASPKPPADGKRPVPPSEGKRPAAAPADTGAVADPEAAAAPSKGALEAVYVDSDKKDVDPTVRSGEEVAAADTEEVGGPSDEEVERVLAKTQPAFRDCVEAELRKNPSFKGGKVTLTATVGSSGTVKAATFDRKDLNRNSPVGTCIRDRAKGMVFSAFAGEDVDLEIPLVLSKSM
ncbi:AgmX/PglI C-terminal domain-containing protein [Myxococcus xanthus]|uniref:AgmX/PglI C-terminal domain-containing protein n=1 Tax=Myxococcus xanthus TaxID=34 RepID=A0A7Y4IIS8_MYXXA|nr:AgmX/PglI C-terminal domain-containing protein [Myxococcus xanthus]NOJ79896.1 AgmX/PglI C-terminal domain-containing protein [Myxococcus xanthus]NOJ86538.1 AgmX/PglI C-terminal domain-containing protein [Myxococcus xanthus]